MQRELKMKELQLLDTTRRKFLQYQQQQKESELNRMDDEIRRKVSVWCSLSDAFTLPKTKIDPVEPHKRDLNSGPAEGY